MKALRVVRPVIITLHTRVGRSGKLSLSGSYFSSPLNHNSRAFGPFQSCRILLQKKDGPGDNTTNNSVVPIHPQLLHLIATLLQSQTKRNTWLPLTELYAHIPPNLRRQYVRPHKTFANVCSRVRSENLLPQIHFILNESGTHFCIGGRPEEPLSVTAAPERGASKPSVTPTVVKSHSPSSPDDMPPVDFYYDVGLSSYPPAPAPLDVVASTLPSPRSTEDGVVVSVKDFRDYIPPYFVPVEALLQCMPGYTLQHLQEYLDTHAVELVRVGESRFIRLHGGFGKIPIHREDGADVEESLKPYQPDPSLVTAFEIVFQGNTDQWMPLEELLGKADPKAVAALPYEGEFAILYFAQMQHKFNFSVSPTSGSAVKLRPVPVRGLTELTTPTPTSLSFFFFTIPTDEQISTEKLKALTPADVASEINLYYGTLESFFAMHGPIFYISEDCSIVMRTSYRRRLQFASLTLEQQLQVAMEKKDKPKIRTIRRRIAFRDNPSHPFHDPDNLAMEVAKYLPRKGHVLMKMFMRHLPEDVINFLPSRHYAFFKGYPQYFQIFEYHKAGTWALSRPGLPLPKGVIRQQFDENDLLRLTAEQLQARGGKASCSTVIVNLPQGAQELVRKRHGGLYYFFEKHPDHFRLVLPSDASNTVSAAVAHLIKVPSTLSVEDDEGGDEPK